MNFWSLLKNFIVVVLGSWFWIHGFHSICYCANNISLDYSMRDYLYIILVSHGVWLRKARRLDLYNVYKFLLNCNIYFLMAFPYRIFHVNLLFILVDHMLFILVVRIWVLKYLLHYLQIWCLFYKSIALFIDLIFMLQIYCILHRFDIYIGK